MQDSDKETAPEGAAPTQPQVPSTVRELHDEKTDYNTAEIAQFISTVFHAPTEQGEVILAQAAPKAPRGFSKDIERIIPLLGRTKVAMPCYFGTSTVGLTDGEVRNKKTAFKRYHVVVLDDVGTKIPWSKIPEGLDPTYQIETSEGNFQLGFVLMDPISDYRVASDLCALVKNSGLTDKGGIMPCKKVRLPCGINGKAGDAGKFRVRLDFMDGPYYDPQELLTAMGVTVDWARIESEGMSKTERARQLGATAWSPVHIAHHDAEGVYDPVMEWLDEQGLLMEDANDDGWATIQCPWHADHTSGDVSAGYNPLGRGESPTKRWFHCFHDHCAGHHTGDFLLSVADRGGPDVPVEEIDPAFYADNVLNTNDGNVVNIRDQSVHPIKLALHEKMARTMVRKTTDDSGKITTLKFNPVAAWVKSPSCVKVVGYAHDATEVSRLVEVNGKLRVNEFHMPHWASVPENTDLSNPFKRYLEYLIPDAEEREYVVKWLAAKVQHRSFRGPALVMIAPVEGAGRNTLMIMLGKMFGPHNVRPVSLKNIENDQFNEYMDSLITYVDETLAAEDASKRYRFYESVKTSVDPLAQAVTINRKYGAKSSVNSVTSFMFFSNNWDAIHVSEGSRRIFTCANPTTVGNPAFFTAVHAWMDKDDWMQHVWNWLMTIEINMGEMSSAPPRTETHDRMMEAGKGALDHILEAALEVVEEHTVLIPVQILADAVEIEFIGGSDLPSHVTRATVIKALNRLVRSLNHHSKSWIPKKAVGKESSYGADAQFTLRTRDEDAFNDFTICERNEDGFKRFFTETSPQDLGKDIREHLAESGVVI